MLTKFQANNIPLWAFQEMMLECPHCGAPIAQNENLTARWCPNKKCPGHMAYKLEDLAKYFKVKGIGPATALSVIKIHKMESHFDVMKFWFPETRPVVRLSVIAALAGIDGYGAVQAERDLDSYGSFEAYFEEAQYVHPLLLENRDLLIHAQQFFNVLPPLSSKYINVMGTGSFHGYSSREEYFNVVNMIFGEYIHVIQCGKRKTNVTFLIKEADAVDHSKSAIAAEYHIPVVTPMEFIQILCEYFHISVEDIKKKGESLRQ